MHRTKSIPVAALALAALALTGCGDNAATPATALSSARSSTATSAASTPTASAATTHAMVPTASTAVRPRTKAELGRALLVLKDLPTGYRIDPDQSGGGKDTSGSVTVSSKNPRCSRLVALTNVDLPPGAVSQAIRSFSGGQDGPYVDESLAGMRSEPVAKAFLAGYRTATKSCPTLTLKISGQGSSPVTVSEVSAPQTKEDNFAARYTATSGALKGLEITDVITRVNDVMVATTYAAAYPEDVEGFTGLAVDKVHETTDRGPQS